MIGMMMSATIEVTIAPNAAPMMTPTARSTTLPFIAKSRNSLSIWNPPSSIRRTGAPSWQGRDLVDQPGMHHGAVHRHAGGLRHRNHRQAQRLVDLAEQRQRVFHRRWVGLDEEIDVQRHQLVVELESGGDITLLPGPM